MEGANVVGSTGRIKYAPGGAVNSNYEVTKKLKMKEKKNSETRCNSVRYPKIKNKNYNTGSQSHPLGETGNRNRIKLKQITKKRMEINS